MPRSGAEIALSLGVVALGIGVAAVTATLPSEGGYAGIGPNFIPAVVAAGILLLGGWLSFQAFTGGWRKPGEQPEAFQPSPFLWVSAGLLVHMLLIGWAGFVIAGTALFACVARGFTRGRWLRMVAQRGDRPRAVAGDLPLLREAAERQPAGRLAGPGPRRRGHLRWRR
jgi:putative tricarboxylic transport membrane protein